MTDSFAVMKAFFIAVCCLAPYTSAQAVEVALSVIRSDCGDPPDEELKRIEWKRLEGAKIEIRAWDVEFGGCTIDAKTAKAKLDGSVVTLSNSKACPAPGDPIPMCAETVRLVYVLSDFPPGKFTVILSGHNPGRVDVGG